MAAYRCLNKQVYSLGDYTIVPLRYEDRFSIMKWRNEQIYHLRQARPLTEEDQQRYFDQVVSRLFEAQQPDQILFSYLEKGECIGYGGLVHINWIDSHAEISFIMDTRLEKEHFARHWSNWLTLVKELAFSELRLHKIFTYAFDLRPHLYSVLEENGFTREATLKEHCFVEGRYKDVIIHSLTARSYRIVNYVDCTREQLEEILTLRNRDDVRVWMTHPEKIAREDHFAFVEKLKERRDRLYYAVFAEEDLLGTYNLTRKEDGVWERGIFANPAWQGKGETARWEQEILSGLAEQGIHCLTAKVKLNNGRSLRYHEKLGFREQSRDSEYVYFTLKLK